jgi:hypothetical protein
MKKKEKKSEPARPNPTMKQGIEDKNAGDRGQASGKSSRYRERALCRPGWVVSIKRAREDDDITMLGDGQGKAANTCNFYGH